MARLGRPPKKDIAKKSAQLSIRISAALRKQLEAASKKAEPPRSLSQEIEFRLTASFGELERVQDQFGGPTNFWLFQTIARRIGTLEKLTRKRWYQDAYTYQQMLRLVQTALGYFRPGGRVAVPRPLKGHPLGQQLAVRALADIEASMGAVESEARRPGDVVGVWPHASEWWRAAGPLVPKLRRSALKDFLKQHG
jgi:hypothetical protein